MLLPVDRAIQQFKANLNEVKKLGVMYVAFVDNLSGVMSLDELLRSEFVLSVGALDCYIHDLVKIGMGLAFIAGYGESNAYLNFGVSLDFVKKQRSALSDDDRLILFEQEIRRLHGYKTFQTADAISQALSLIGIKTVWDKVGRTLSMDTVDVRDQLDLIVDRRNRIAHESDVDPTLGIGNKYPIDSALVDETVEFLNSIAHAIHQTAQDEIKY